eukprot:GHUV01011179.1.p1 GENE.GHUV01011179.1~~GHUV01011179.1.p1  ORF type:complete len:196 (+),score=33.49 GHUV01011179.1:304-891(+)
MWWTYRMTGELDLQQCLQVATDAASAAGAIIKKAINSSKQVEQKSSHVDLVTATDKQCESIIRSILEQHFPQHRFIGEEEASETGGQGDLTDEPTWMVDPLDGTTNFVHGYPFTCVSIGLTINRMPVVGVVHNPILDEMFTAVKGNGAHLNGQPITVSNRQGRVQWFAVSYFLLYLDTRKTAAEHIVELRQQCYL